QGTNSVNFDAGFLPSSVNICVRAVNSCGQSVVRCKTVSLAQGGGGAQSQMISEEPIENEKLVDPMIFPNPSEDIINLSFEDSELNDNLTVDLLDAGGMLIQRLNYQSTYGTTMQVSLSDLPAGMYMFRMCTVDGQVATKRFVKQ
ncbi:MAG: T9SS type A sorting domain-containing protein, partial [Flavobacteriales bacterium]